MDDNRDNDTRDNDEKMRERLRDAMQARPMGNRAASVMFGAGKQDTH